MLTPSHLRTQYHTNALGLDRARPRLSWEARSESADQRQTGRQVTVTDQIDQTVVWDSGRHNDDAMAVTIGTDLTAHGRYAWQVRLWNQDGIVGPWSSPCAFTLGFQPGDTWPGSWIGHHLNRGTAVPALRREFTVDEGLVDARLTMACRGIADCFLNGTTVSDELFSCGWTDYRLRIPSRTWDVTTRLTPGTNCIGLLLDKGWFAGPLAWNQQRHAFGDAIAARIALRLTYADGQVVWIASDSDWRSAPSGILTTSFLNGESYDPSLDPTGWHKVGFDDKAWAPVRTVDDDTPIVWHAGRPVRRIAEFKTQEKWQPRPGVWILDIGRNIAGFARLRVNAPAGTTIRLRFSEVLQSDRSIYVDNLRSALATDTYTCRGDGVEVWEPRFTFHGFRYVEITGLPCAPADDTITGIAISSDCPEAGSFTSAEPLLETIAANAVWTQRANYIDVPTDCPQRDERLGWTGDAQAYMRTAICFHDVAAFHAKWLQDLDDATTAEGRAPCVAPRVPESVDWDADAAWGDATTICPWQYYLWYGDQEELGRRYNLMKRYLGYYRRTTTPNMHLRYDPPGCETFGNVSERPPLIFGDWLAVENQTANEIIRSAFYAESCRLVRNAAQALGDSAEADAREKEWQAIRLAFTRIFVSDDGTVIGQSRPEPTQTAQLLALHFDLLPEQLRQPAADRLVSLIADRDGHLSTGFVGLPYLLPVLSRFGYTSTAYDLLLRRTYPSWGYEVDHGATSIWERWNGYHHEKGPGDPNMNSYSHYAYGAVCEWFFTDIAGIEPLEPGFKRFRIRPRIDPRLGHARASYRSIRGPITVAWQQKDGVLDLMITVPANTTAEVHVPTTGAITVDGQMVSSEPSAEKGYHCLELGSGKRRLCAPCR
jgi:alpha-L-rhamnosidase